MHSVLKNPVTRKISRSPFLRRMGATREALAKSKRFGMEYFADDNYAYEEWHIDQSRWIVSYMFDYVRPGADWVYLDVGCAMGGVVEILRRRKVEAYGVDVSKYCIDRSRVGKYLRLGSATCLPCRDKSVDVSTCIDTFQYLKKNEAKQAIDELKRVTKKYVCFECITQDDRLGKQQCNPDKERKWQSLLPRKEIRELFKDKGFEEVVTGWLPRHIDGCWLSHGWYEYDFSFNAIFAVQ